MQTTTAQQVLARKSQRLLSIAPDATVFDALTLMALHDIGSLVVLDGERLTGIFSERDYARQVVLLGKSSKETRVRDIMTHKVVPVSPDLELREAALQMDYLDVHRLFVLDGDRLVGVISRSDINRAFAAGTLH